MAAPPLLRGLRGLPEDGRARPVDLQVVRRRDYEQGRFSLVYLATEPGEPEVELTHNWDHAEPYSGGRNFGHLAFAVDDIYETCSRLMEAGVVINRPPRDGRMAFVQSPDGHSIELLLVHPALQIW